MASSSGGVPPPTCKQCRETAPANCIHGLCGKHCFPRCAPGNHSQRHAARGTVGRGTRGRWDAFWAEAGRLADEWFSDPMSRGWREYYHVSFVAARYRFLQHVLREARQEVSEEAMDPLAASFASPAAQWNLVQQLQAKFTTGELTGESWPVSLPEPESETFPEAAPTTTASSSSAAVPSRWVRKRPALEGPRELSAERELSPVSSKSPCAEPTDLPAANTPMNVDLPAWAPESREPTCQGAPCAHYRRDFPPFRGGKKSREVYQTETSAKLYSMAPTILQSWMALRPGLIERLGVPLMRPYAWGDNNDGSPVRPGLHDAGVWFYMPLREWNPSPPVGTDLSTWRLQGYDMSRAIHATSMYVLHRIVVDGLVAGPLPGKGGVIAVFAYAARGDGEALSSSGYAVYSDLCDNGLYFSVRVELAVPLWRSGEPEIGKISVGNNQWALRPGAYHVTGIWIHALAESDMVPAGGLWSTHDKWFPEYEVRTLSGG